MSRNSPQTVTLWQTCRARKDLVAHRVAVANQLRAHLQLVFPGAVRLFADIDSPISLRFLDRFDCQERADWLGQALRGVAGLGGRLRGPAATTSHPTLPAPSPPYSPFATRSSRPSSPASGAHEGRKPITWTPFDRYYETLRIDLQTLFTHLGITTIQPAAA